MRFNRFRKSFDIFRSFSFFLLKKLWLQKRLGRAVEILNSELDEFEALFTNRVYRFIVSFVARLFLKIRTLFAFQDWNIVCCFWGGFEYFRSFLWRRSFTFLSSLYWFDISIFNIFFHCRYTSFFFSLFLFSFPPFDHDVARILLLLLLLSYKNDAKEENVKCTIVHPFSHLRRRVIFFFFYIYYNQTRQSINFFPRNFPKLIVSR